MFRQYLRGLQLLDGSPASNKKDSNLIIPTASGLYIKKSPEAGTVYFRFKRLKTGIPERNY